MNSRLLGCLVTMILIATVSVVAAAQCTRCGPGLTVSPHSLSFPPQVVGTTSAAMTVTLRSVGIFPVTFNGIVSSGPSFSETNNCPHSLPRNATCHIRVTFAPTAIGTFNGATTIRDSAGTQVVTLSGTGVAAAGTSTTPSLDGQHPPQLDTPQERELALQHGQYNSENQTLYDNFDGRFLSHSRWGYGICYSGSGAELECVREIRNGQLHLAHRSFGLSDSDTGMQNGSALVGFVDSAAIKSIRIDLIVRNVLEVPCAAHPGWGANAGFWGTFFNAGTGDPNDDVGAQINLGRLSTDPPGQLIARGQTFHAGVYSEYFTLGTVSIGTPVTLSLKWNQSNHEFDITLTNQVTHVTTSAAMPYTFSDTTPVAGPAKVLGAGGFTSNCTANPASLYVDATFDNVYVTK